MRAEGPFLEVQSGTLVCALPVKRVCETMRALPVTPFEWAPPHVVGLSRVRGVPTPVVDLGALLGQPPVPLHRYVTVRGALGAVALGVEAVHGVWTRDEAVRPARPVCDGVDTRRLEAALAIDEGLMALLEESLLLDPTVTPVVHA